jgi:hypothetical protein
MKRDDSVVNKEEGRMTSKKMYTKPELIVHGTLQQLTQQTKNKFWGGTDDVIVQQQAILHSGS